MTQKELNQAVAEATGESVEMIASIGFSLEAVQDIEENRMPIEEKTNFSDLPKIHRTRLCPAA